MKLKRKIVELEFLREIDYGPDENRRESEVRERLGSALDNWENNGIAPQDWHFDRTEITEDWRTFLHGKGQANRDAVELVVTSNGIARLLLDVCDWNNDVVRKQKMRTGAYSKIYVDAEKCEITQWDIRPD